ncbi:ATP-grasp domain-containing protein [Bradyrhizobium sp. CB1650]|uniref:ATP-grasp domain-containing protein n=1 Tax=Bradyrhizobium sp. CB1650 TaxID=3039153 RepID=UPI0024357F47|nr:ATP-grasp domain-containing protein [Bradyrhizobium sp. CB1650]WGD51110.1 ATP-grasp domain-containing protein [Bradyrhizobium sp. CB1650]
MVRRALILLERNVFGANTGLLYVQAARRLDLCPITLSADPTQYDNLAAEGLEVVRVDTSDFNALVSECSRLRATYDIAGIISPREAFCATAARLCRHFDLPGPDPASIDRCCDKFAQRQLLAQSGIAVPAYYLALDAADVQRSAALIGLPVIVKPAVGTGSAGVRLCRNIDEVAEHTSYLLGGKHVWRSAPRILVEEFAEGPYYSADLMGNEVFAIATAEFGPLPHFVFHGGTYPAQLTHEEHTRIEDVSLSCLRALGLGWGPATIELRWTMRGPVVIEVTPRLGGGSNPQLAQLAYGVDFLTEHIKLAIGKEWDLQKSKSLIAGSRVLNADRDGIVDWINDDSLVAAIPGLAEVKLYVKPKTRIFQRYDYRDRIGHVLASSPSFAQTESILNRALDLIGWSITQSE